MSSSEQTSIHGSCLCKGITYSIHDPSKPPPNLIDICHCANCQKWSGSPFASNVFFLESQVKISDPSSLLRTYSDSATLSGQTIDRQFCSRCGSCMFISVHKELDEEKRLDVLSGTIDDVETRDWEPGEEIWCKTRRRWLPAFRVSEGVKSYEEGSEVLVKMKG